MADLAHFTQLLQKATLAPPKKKGQGGKKSLAGGFRDTRDPKRNSRGFWGWGGPKKFLREKENPPKILENTGWGGTRANKKTPKGTLIGPKGP